MCLHKVDTHCTLTNLIYLQSYIHRFKIKVHIHQFKNIIHMFKIWIHYIHSSVQKIKHMNPYQTTNLITMITNTNTMKHLWNHISFFSWSNSCLNSFSTVLIITSCPFPSTSPSSTHSQKPQSGWFLSYTSKHYCNNFYIALM